MPTQQFPLWAGVFIGFQILITVLIGLLAYWGKRSDSKQDTIAAELRTIGVSFSAKLECAVDAIYKKFDQYQTKEKSDLHHDGHKTEHQLEGQMNATEHRRLERDQNGLGSKLGKIDDRLANIERSKP